MKANTANLARTAALLSISVMAFTVVSTEIAISEPTFSEIGGCTNNIECDDGLPCTVDTCDFPATGPAGSGSCMHAPVPNGQPGGVGGPDCPQKFGLLCGGCDDGLFCNGAEVCQAGTCAPGTPPCTGGQVCCESLDVCQPGACSEQKTCIGGPTPGAACTTTFACGNGGRCGFADCDDGVLCNGDESCIAGVCQAGENPCGPNALCGERQCSVGAGVDICLTDEDCAGGMGTCSLIGPVCLEGGCCRTSGSATPGEPSCERRRKKGVCSGSTPGTNAGSACSAHSQCHSNNCLQIAASCDSLGGIFHGGDYGFIPNGDGACPFINGIPIKCPKYSSGIAPSGQVADLVGAVSSSPVANPAVGVSVKRLGDDYRLSNYGVCVGGTRSGLGCGSNTDCPGGGACNLSGQSVLSVNYLRIAGGLFSDTRAVVEFRDAGGKFVVESYALHEQLNGVDRFFFDPPVIIPSEGFVILRVASEFTPNGGFVWASTEAVDVGWNDPNVLWINDGPVANFLAPNPGILAFELEGEKVAAPLGACCDSSGAGCTDGVLPWVCEGDGNHFQGVGSTCPAPACDIGACCNPNTGACTVGTQTVCASAGGEFQGFGTDCDVDHGFDSGLQHCCPQPPTMFGGADRCEDVVIHVVTAPPPGETRVLTITGDNSSATLHSGETPCYSGAETPPIELGWYEGFEFFFSCAMIRVDYCCTDPVKRPAYPVLFNSCPCITPILSNANPYLFPQADHDRGGPYCDDQNQWATFGPLPAGTYYIPVQSGVPGSVGPYQIHITAEACPTAACCVADQCADGVNQLECDALGGTFLAPPQKVPAVADCSSNPCTTGSCCSGPGECSDVRLGQPMTSGDCASLPGSYHGGVRCQGGSCSVTSVESCSVNSDCPGNESCVGTPQQLGAPSPCPLCSIEGSGNCQAFDDTFNFTPSDRHLGQAGLLAADDFRPGSGILDHVCVWGFYLDADPNAALPDCSFLVTSDHFRVRVFANDPATERSPGLLVGESTATSQSAILPQTLIHTRLQTNVYGYELILSTPITGMIPGEVYWIEVSNDVSDSLSSCNWHWSQLAPTPSSFSFTGSEVGYWSGVAIPFDNVFCLNMNISPTGVGVLPGACCPCGQSCSLETLANCAHKNGVWDIAGTTCEGITCQPAPLNDNCVDGPPAITEGSYVVSNQCASTDGYGPIPSDVNSSQLDFDLWYNFIAPTSCDLVVSECQTGFRFDSMLAVYMNCPPGSPVGCDETICPPCPLDAATSSATLAGVAQDESCSGGIGGAGVWRASEQILRNAMPGECFLLRVGSFPGNRGTAILDVSCGPLCIPSTQPVCEPYFIEFTRFIALGCGLFHPCQNPIPVVGAIRVHLTSLHHVNPPYTGGPSIPFTSFEGQVRWVGPPTQYVESTATPTPFWASKLQCAPYYQDWSTIPLLYVTGPEIVPSSTYQYELLKNSCQGIEESCTDVSQTLTVHTTRWGDVEMPYNPPDTASQPDLGDVSALVNKFKNVPGAPIKARALLAGVDALGNVNLVNDIDFSHIAACVDAFKGRPYPHVMVNCP